MIVVHGELSWALSSDRVEACVTARGGHLAPVRFQVGDRTVSPYALAPWLPGEFEDVPALLDVLRGDFLCLPFGGQSDGPPHGCTANDAWTLVAKEPDSLTLAIDASDHGVHVEKILIVRPGQSAIYQEHRISGLEGVFNYGNHPILDLSGVPEGGAQVSTSAMRWASVYPDWFSDPADGATQRLERGAEFSELKAVALVSGGTADLSRQPGPVGYDDLVMMVNEPSGPFAWSAVTLDGYVWFQLKNPADFPATLLWMSNGGRSASPWKGRHFSRLGVEEVCSHFCDGVDVAREDRLPGIPTSRHFRHDETVSLRIVQAVAAIPKNFGAVTVIEPEGDSAVRITGESGESVICPLDWRFVV